MTKKITILLHSKTGLSALAAGLRLTAGSPVNLVTELLRLWPQMRKPGQFVSLETQEERVICFNSGATPRIVQMVFDTSIVLWELEHLHAKSLPEGPLAGLRARLLMHLPRHRWLLKFEVTAGGNVELWK